MKKTIEFCEFEERLRQQNKVKKEYFKVRDRVEFLLEKAENLVAAMEKLEDKNDPLSIAWWLWKCREFQKTLDKLTVLTPAFETTFQKWEDTINAL